MKDTMIYRSISNFDAITDENSRTISGQAIVFDSWSKRMVDMEGKYFYERILPQAITQDLINSSDVIMNLNHDDNQMLARWNKGNGTLHLELREDGLYFSFQAPETSLGDEVLYNVRNGNLFECSFRFSIRNEDIKRYKEDGEYRVDIINIRSLSDCSIVTHGAYGATSVYTRNDNNEDVEVKYDELFEDVIKREEEERQAEQERQEQERKDEIIRSLDAKLEEFYKNIDNQ